MEKMPNDCWFLQLILNFLQNLYLRMNCYWFYMAAKLKEKFEQAKHEFKTN